MSWVKIFVIINIICIMSLIVMVEGYSLVAPEPKPLSAVQTHSSASLSNPLITSSSKNVLTGNTTAVVLPPDVIEPSPLPVVQATPEPTPDSRCIILIDGVQYNMSEFRNIHGGGDVFTCGADMSQVFHNQHPQSYIDRLSHYRI